MRAALVLCLIPFLAAPVLAGTPAAPPPVAPRAAPAEVTLVVKKPLRLVEYVYGGKRSGQVGLEGVLVIELFNPGTEPSPLTPLDVQGLVFKDRKTGAEHRILHPCDCALLTGFGGDADDSVPTPARFEALAPGEHFVVGIDAFDCAGGLFRAPPPGDYDVTYRVARGKPGQLPAGSRPADPTAMMEACRTLLSSPAFWNDGPVSRPVRVKLGRPVRKRL